MAKWRVTREERLVRTYEVEAENLYDAAYQPDLAWKAPGKLHQESILDVRILDSQHFLAEELDEMGELIREYGHDDLIGAIAQRI
jgi:hypothetical protein